MGDSVNLAARLEGVNKNYGTKIIISKATYRYVQNEFICRILDQIVVTGKSQVEVIYELLQENDSADADQYRKFAEEFEKAYELYLKRRWSDALGTWQALAKENPDDKVTALYIEKCHKYIENEPGEDWDGATRLTSK